MTLRHDPLGRVGHTHHAARAVNEQLFFNHSRCTDVQTRAGWQGQQVNAGGGDVFAEIAGPDREVACHQFVEQLGADQMHLPQVRVAGIAGDARAMAHGLAGMGVTSNAQTGHQRDGIVGKPAEAVAVAAIDGQDTRLDL